MAKKTPEINSSSQADIAFLLLCFFLMTTSMDVDYGITRRLPPPVEQNVDDVTPPSDLGKILKILDQVCIKYSSNLRIQLSISAGHP